MKRITGILAKSARAIRAACAVEPRAAADLAAVEAWLARSVALGPRRALLAFVDLRALRTAAPKGEGAGFSTPAGYARSLVGRLRRFVGPDGTLFLATPAIADPRIWSLERRIFDPASTPAAGYFGEIARRTPGAVRGVNPLFNLTGFGVRAGILTRPQDDGLTRPMGRGSPWEALAALDPHVALIGAGDGADWTLLLPAHDEPPGDPWPAFFDKPWPFRVRSPDGGLATRRWDVHALRNALAYDLGAYLPMAEHAAALGTSEDGARTEWIGTARLRAFRLADRQAAQRRLGEAGAHLFGLGTRLTRALP